MLRQVLAVAVVLVVAGGTLATVGVVAQDDGVDDQDGDGATQLDSCTTITEPGRYVLASDLEGVNGTCIEIRASDVVLDGNGHTIGGVQNQRSLDAFAQASLPGGNATTGGGGATPTETGTPSATGTETPAATETPATGTETPSAGATGTPGAAATATPGGAGTPTAAQGGPAGGAAANDTQPVEGENLTTAAASFPTPTDPRWDNVGVAVAGNESLSNVTVRDLTVTDLYFGVSLDGAFNSTVRSVNATGNGDGLELYRSEGVDVVDTRLADNRWGAFAAGVAETDFTNVTAEANRQVGISVALSDNVDVRNASVSDNGVGVVAERSGDVWVDESTVEENDAAGVVFLDAPNATVSSSTVAETTGFDELPIAAPPAGVLFVNSTNGEVLNTQFEDNARWDVYAANGSTVTGAGVTLNGTSAAFEATDAALSGNASVAQAPGGWQAVGAAVATNGTSADAVLRLDLDYDEEALGGANESQLSTWVHRDGQWIRPAEGGVDTTENTASVRLTEFGTVALLAQSQDGGNRSGGATQTATPTPG